MRSHAIGRNLSLVAGMLFLTTAGAVHAQYIESEQQFIKRLPERPAKAEMLRMCSTCHSVEEIGVVGYSRQGWQELVSEMVKRGAVDKDRDIESIVNYLFEISPARIDINRAIPMQFMTDLALSEADSEKIVAFRTQHGPFRRWQDLQLVPGIDFKKVADRSEIVVVGP